MSREVDTTQAFIELLERVSFSGLLRLVTEAIDVEIDLDSCETDLDASRKHQLLALKEHLLDVAADEAAGGR